MAMTIRRPTPAEVYERAYVPAIFTALTRLVIDVAEPRPGEAVLDLACGTGIVARNVAPLVGEAGSIVALDIRPGMLAVARRTAPPGASIEWVEGDATAMALPDGRFDLVICQQGLQFFEPRDAALREIRRVLRPGGRLAAAVWRMLDEQTLFRELTAVEARHLEPLGLTWEAIANRFLWGDPDVIRGAFETAGFADVRIEAATIETDFAADTFVADVEYAYQATVPAFIGEPALYRALLRAVKRDMRTILERYRVGDRLRAPMPTNLISARRPS